MAECGCCKLMDETDAKELFDSVDTVLTDCDGIFFSCCVAHVKISINQPGHCIREAWLPGGCVIEDVYELEMASTGPYKPRTGQCMNMHRLYWPHRPYTVYMAVLYFTEFTDAIMSPKGSD